MARRSIPERTVDAWVTTAVHESFPGARIWAPTQNDKSNWDTGVGIAGKALILEDKATTPVKRKLKAPKDFHRIDIDLGQLRWYCKDVERLHTVPAYYVLPNPPWIGEPTGSDALPDQVKHQPTFATWTWVVRCHHMWALLGSKKYIETHTLPASAAVTLDAFLKQVRSCQAGARIPAKPTASQRRAEARRLEIGANSTDFLDFDHRYTRSSLAVFVPATDLPTQKWFT